LVKGESSSGLTRGEGRIKLFEMGLGMKTSGRHVVIEHHCELFGNGGVKKGIVGKEMGGVFCLRM